MRSPRRTTPAAFSALATAFSLVLSAGGAATAAEPGPAIPVTALEPPVTRVVAVSIDGLNPAAIRKLGPERAPALHRLIAQGASTLNARTSRELTDTLPNHAGMVTGRRIDADRDGHGVTWNRDRKRPATVHQAAGHDVSSVFRVVDSPARDTALFASKTKFSLFERSWDRAIDKYRYRADNTRLARIMRRDLLRHERAFTFLHLSAPDVAGHASGFMSGKYLRAVEGTDRLLGRLLRTLDNHPGIKDELNLIVTADHGGPRGHHLHGDPDVLANYRIPFVVWGPGVTADADLYDLNPDYAEPGRRRTTYAADKQPVRNSMLANLATDLLGLDAVHGSEFNRAQDLDVS